MANLFDCFSFFSTLLFFLFLQIIASIYSFPLSGERWEWIKPIMFSAGIGSIDDRYCRKHSPQVDMLVTKIGGPVYRIGVGGGAASSTEVQGKG